MTKRKEYPTQERLRELFDYDPEGFLVWRRSSRRIPAGARAGVFSVTKNLTSVYSIGVDGGKYVASRLIWIYFNGEIDSRLFVNRKDTGLGFFIENLFISEKIKIGKARYFSSKNGYLGVTPTKTGKFMAYNAGTYDHEEDAVVAYDNRSEDLTGRRPNNTIRRQVTPVSINIVSLNRSLKNKLKSGKLFGFSKERGKFRVKIGHKHVGIYKTEIEAARAYNIAAREKYGEHAVLNDLPDPFGDGAPI